MSIVTVFEITIWIIFGFCLSIMATYFLLSFQSYKILRNYFIKNSFCDVNVILNSPLAPPISLISPAYNESATIIDNVRAQLSLHYSNFEVIIVNDGSRDDTLQKLINAFHLSIQDISYKKSLPNSEILGVYKSTNPAFAKLTVVDKVNGGKSDALNAGINFSTAPYISCVDVDCVLEQDSLLKMIKPFLENTGKRVIATGGVIRIANGCIIENGKLVNVEVPEKFLARLQVMEYLRAFLLGRMAWSKMDGLLLISGAFGLFDKDVVINSGGYFKDCVSEDMELVVRLRRYMHENKMPYEATYIPDPLCWTEVPDNYTILGRQRSRWARGTAETLAIHKRIFFNPKYKVMGIISYPYWLTFEFLAPIAEIVGMVFTIFLAVNGMIDWSMFFLLILFVYTFALLFSLIGLLAEEETFHEYKTISDYLKLIYAAMLEPIFFHPYIVFSTVRGDIQLLFGKKSWGKMTRTGFAKQKMEPQTV